MNSNIPKHIKEIGEVILANKDLFNNYDDVQNFLKEYHSNIKFTNFELVFLMSLPFLNITDLYV